MSNNQQSVISLRELTILYQSQVPYAHVLREVRATGYAAFGCIRIPCRKVSGRWVATQPDALSEITTWPWESERRAASASSTTVQPRHVARPAIGDDFVAVMKRSPGTTLEQRCYDVFIDGVIAGVLIDSGNNALARDVACPHPFTFRCGRCSTLVYVPHSTSIDFLPRGDGTCDHPANQRSIWHQCRPFIVSAPDSSWESGIISRRDLGRWVTVTYGSDGTMGSVGAFRSKSLAVDHLTGLHTRKLRSAS